MEGQIEGPKNDLIKEGETWLCPSRSMSTTSIKPRASTSRQRSTDRRKRVLGLGGDRFHPDQRPGSITGMVRFYLMEMGERFRLYISPPISAAQPRRAHQTPSGYSRELADHVGLFTPSACRPIPRR